MGECYNSWNMKSSQTVVYLNIGGFFIKIYFHDAENIFLQKKITDEIYKQYGKFIVSDPHRIDFYIDFTEKKFVLSLIRKKIDFFMFYTRIKPRNIETYYHISLAQVDILIKRILFILLRGKGFILHASASNVGGNAYIFTGKSTAGKSTAMKLLSEKYPPLADDSIIIRKQNGKFYAYQTPFIEKEHWLMRGKERYTIGKLFFLRKTPYFKTKKISDKEYIIRKLSSQFMVELPEMVKHVNILFEFVSRFDQCYELSFAIDKKKISGIIEKPSSN